MYCTHKYVLYKFTVFITAVSVQDANAHFFLRKQAPCCQEQRMVQLRGQASVEHHTQQLKSFGQTLNTQSSYALHKRAYDCKKNMSIYEYSREARSR